MDTAPDVDRPPGSDRVDPVRWPFRPTAPGPLVLTVVAGIVAILFFGITLLSSGLSPAETLDDPVRALDTVTELERRLAETTAGWPPSVRRLFAEPSARAREEAARRWAALLAEAKAAPELGLDPARVAEARDAALAAWDDGTTGRAWPIVIQSAAVMGIQVLGVGLLVVWLARGRRDLALLPRPALRGFGLGYGGAVFLWSQAAFVVVLGAIILADGLGAPFGEEMWATSSFLTGAPALVLAYALLLRPRGAVLGDTWGVERRGLILPLVVAVLAVDWSVELGAGLLAPSLGQAPEWQMYVDETLLYGGVVPVMLSGADAILGAALVEEVLFRGVLFGALRARLPAVPAALVSGLIFGFAHGYDPVGSVVVSFSGFLYAMVYERTRSLAPCILVHALSNANAVAAMLVVRMTL